MPLISLILFLKALFTSELLRQEQAKLNEARKISVVNVNPTNIRPHSDTPEIRKYKKRFNSEILCAALWGKLVLVTFINGLKRNITIRRLLIQSWVLETWLGTVLASRKIKSNFIFRKNWYTQDNRRRSKMILSHNRDGLKPATDVAPTQYSPTMCPQCEHMWKVRGPGTTAWIWAGWSLAKSQGGIYWESQEKGGCHRKGIKADCAGFTAMPQAPLKNPILGSTAASCNECCFHFIKEN